MFSKIVLQQIPILRRVVVLFEKLTCKPNPTLFEIVLAFELSFKNSKWSRKWAT